MGNTKCGQSDTSCLHCLQNTMGAKTSTTLYTEHVYGISNWIAPFRGGRRVRPVGGCDRSGGMYNNRRISYEMHRRRVVVSTDLEPYRHPRNYAGAGCSSGELP